MEVNIMSEKYFLGAMTQYGFSTEFSKLIGNKDNFTYILKGGAGTGKSSLMKKVAKEFEDDEKVVRYYCSSDPSSLDAVVLESSRVIIVDGTSPHVFDPQYPGCCQKILDLGTFWDDENLKKNKDEIIEVTDKNKSLLARVKRYTVALSNVCSDTYFCALDCIDNDKLNAFLGRFCKKILPKKGGGSGRKDIRQLTALTEHGCMTQLETLDNYSEIYSVCDENYACAHIILESVAKEAISRGSDVIICPSHAFNNDVFEHLLIPETGTALISSSPLTKLHLENAKTLDLKRFYDKTKLAKFKTRLRLNKLTSAGLLPEIFETIKSAKSVHDEIEKYYIESMDYQGINELTEKLIEQIKERKNTLTAE